MVSRYAISVITARMKQGVVFRPEDIVRLNALGLRIEKHTHSANEFAVTRCAIVTLPQVHGWRRVLRLPSEVVFREPSLATEMWIDEVARYCDFDDAATLFAVTAFAYATEAENLPAATNQRAVAKAVRRFIRCVIGRLTRRQITNAVDYCARGNDANANEFAVHNPREKDELDWDAERMSVAAGILRDGIAVRLGVSVDEILHMTADEVRAITRAALALDGAMIDEKERKNRADADFTRTLDDIIARRETRKD